MSVPGVIALSLLTPGTAVTISLHPCAGMTVEQRADPSLHLLLFQRATRAVPASRALWESRGPEVHRSVPPVWLRAL